MVKLPFGADLEVKVVPEWFCVIAASLRSIKTPLIGHEMVQILKASQFRRASLKTTRKQSCFKYSKS